MNRKIVISTGAVALIAALFGGLAYADREDGKESAAADLAKAKITLAQAVIAAETKAGGKATQAELDSENGKVVFKVEVVAAGKMFDVKVDAADGNVLSSVEDRLDRGKEDDDD